MSILCKNLNKAQFKEKKIVNARHNLHQRIEGKLVLFIQIHMYKSLFHFFK